jgi:hypothetical protein
MQVQFGRDTVLTPAHRAGAVLVAEAVEFAASPASG